MQLRLMKNIILWGIFLWFIGYLLGIVLFMVAPPSLIGWIIMPIGVILTWWVVSKKMLYQTISEYIAVGFLWASIAILFDYLFLVQLFKPEDGYYKIDVYLYYLITFLLPIVVGYLSLKQNKKIV